MPINRPGLLSCAADGVPILLTATGSTVGQGVHVATTSTADGLIAYDEVWLYGSNISTGDASVVLHFTTSTADQIRANIAACTIITLLPGHRLRTATLKAFAPDGTGKGNISLFGDVNQYRSA